MHDSRCYLLALFSKSLQIICFETFHKIIIKAINELKIATLKTPELKSFIGINPLKLKLKTTRTKNILSAILNELGFVSISSNPIIKIDRKKKSSVNIRFNNASNSGFSLPHCT